MRINLAISPCPNDTFIFDGLVNKKIDTEDLDFKVTLADIGQLNKWSIENRYDVTKLSYYAYTKCFDHYKILNSGSAIGEGCGPILIRRPDTILCDTSKIAIPGEYTTANMLLDIACPNLKNKEAVVFSEIEKLVVDNKYDAGLIIHENRFTYKEKGLVKEQDLGEFWSKETDLPIPLGGIVVSRDLDLDIQYKIDRIIKKSLQYAFKNQEVLSEFIKLNAQEMDERVIKSHISLYVNDFSLSLGDLGKSSILKIFEKLNIDYCDIFLDNND
jgi:1,4-dihydroxy-6-naphthoate synthase